jgi:uncharacterized membrane protein
MDLLRLTLTIVLAAVFIGMGVAHFVPGPGRGMAAMIPPFFRRPGWPSAKWLVRFTGVCEIAGGIGLLVPQLRVAASIALIVFLIAVFPANAYAAKNPERFGTAAIPFWPRLAGQVALVALLVIVNLPL